MLKPSPIEPVPEATARGARAALLLGSERRAELGLAQPLDPRRQPCRPCRASLDRPTRADPSPGWMRRLIRMAFNSCRIIFVL